MKGLKGILQTLISILLIIALGGFLLPSVQKIEKVLLIKAKPEAIVAALNKSLDSLGIPAKASAQFSFASQYEGIETLNLISVKKLKEGSELTWVRDLNVGNNILKKYHSLITRQIEAGKLEQEMILVKMNSEKK